jgi:hypothetical protein
MLFSKHVLLYSFYPILILVCFSTVKLIRLRTLPLDFYWFKYDISGPGSSVSIATGYGLDGPGIESRWGRDFPHLSRPAVGPTHLLYNRYRVFPGGRMRPGRDAYRSPLLVPRSKNRMELYIYSF